MDPVDLFIGAVLTIAFVGFVSMVRAIWKLLSKDDLNDW